MPISRIQAAQAIFDDYNASHGRINGVESTAATAFARYRALARDFPDFEKAVERRQGDILSLDALRCLDASGWADGVMVILPIWHRVTKDEVMKFSPKLADLVALNSSIKSIQEIAAKLADEALDGKNG